MIIQAKFQHRLLWLGALLLTFSLFACGGHQAQPETAKSTEPVKLGKAYQNVIFYDVECKPSIKRDYPTAAAELQHSSIAALQMKKMFNKVGVAKSGQSFDNGALIVRANITYLRIVSGAARFWGGAFAGSSGVELDLQLIDGATNTVIREDKLNSHNNPWGAAYTGGSTDRSLAGDMGKILAEYIAASMPKE